MESLIFIGIISVFLWSKIRKESWKTHLLDGASEGTPAVHPLVVTLKQQCVSKIVDVSDRFTLSSRPQTVIHPIKAADQFKVVNEREIQVLIQSCQLEGRLDPPAPRRKGAHVGGLPPCIDIFALKFEIGADVHSGIDDDRRPELVPRVVPWTGHTRNSEFQIIIRFQREEPPEPATATNRRVLIPCIAVGLNANITKVEVGQHVATAVNEICVSGPVH